MSSKNWLKLKLEKVNRNIKKLYLAITSEETPWYIKSWGYLVMIYALSPIDLIPDFIPILGYLDDIILIPFGIWIFVKLLSKKRWDSYDEMIDSKEVNLISHWYYAVPIIIIWLLLVGLVWYILYILHVLENIPF